MKKYFFLSIFVLAKNPLFKKMYTYTLTLTKTIIFQKRKYFRYNIFCVKIYFNKSAREVGAGILLEMEIHLRTVQPGTTGSVPLNWWPNRAAHAHTKMDMSGR